MTEPLVTAHLGGLTGAAVSPLQLAMDRAHQPPAALKRARDIIGCGITGEISVPLTTAEIRTALREFEFFVERLPFVSESHRITITAEDLKNAAVCWALARALVNNVSVEVVGT